MRRIEKTGQSMHDHPSTWDYDSDQLAEELAAFALEISHNEKQAEQSSRSSETTHVGLKNANMIADEDFIYDMFIRVPIGHGKSEEQALSDVGVLVIDDEYQELWQTFAENDSDSEWDEEDPDSNGLC
jgi:Transcription factor Iwr1